MDSCEGSHPIARSGTVRAKPGVMADGKNEPAGEGLPDGWFKECRPRKNRYGSRIKGDMFYIDPINGYEFRSLKDVYRYLESGDISQCVMLPNKRKIEDLHTAADHSHHIGKPSDYTQLDTDDESNQYDLLRGTKALRSGKNAENIPLSKPDGINPIQREAVRVESSEGKIIQSGSMEHTPGKSESITGEGANVEQKPKEKKQKTKPVKGIATLLRSSPRLAALKITEEANNAPREGPISTQTNTTNQLQPKQVKNPRRKANSSVLPEKKDGAPTLSSSEKVGDNYPLVPNQIQGASVPYSLADVGCQNAPTGASVLPQEVGLGETADDMHGSALSSLFRQVWSDPCLEFAFRTLTGDIPVLGDTLAVPNDFLPPQNLNKGATPNCSSSAYDGTRNHAQVDHVGLSMPRPSDKLYGSSWFPPQ